MIKKNIISGLKWLAGLLLLAFLVWGTRLYLVESVHISTDSMETALHKGDLVLVNKLPFLKEPKRNEVVLFSSPLRRDSVQAPLLLSRCIAVPGDTIQVHSYGYRINGKDYPRSPNALNRYSMPQIGVEALIRLIQEQGIPQRDWKRAADGSVTCTFTSFEEYQLREELPDTLKSLFAQIPMPSYQFIVPQKDRAYPLDSLSLLACREAILNETEEQAVFRDGALYLEGKQTHFFFFRQDYYWCLSDNVSNAVDSRHVGFIPADHIWGKLFFCWYSRDMEKRFKRVK